ncbi:MAG: NAD-dependent epimerase/dehydratase family protein [Bacteroidales bacterium]
MKIAVTGANGHVGANLCRALVAEGHQVKALVHVNRQSLNGLNIEYISGSLDDEEALRRLCHDVEIVFHLAAMISIDGKRKKLLRVNVDGTTTLLKIIRENGIRRLIHFSSIHALSHFPLDEPMDETRPLVEKGPMWYEITKSQAEKLVLKAVSEGLDAVIINPTAIVGPNDFMPSLVGQVLIRLYNRTLPALVPGGYNWVDVRDVVSGAIAAMDKGRKGERYILGGKWFSVQDLALIVEKTTGRKITRFMIPQAVAKIGVPFIKAYAFMAGTEPLYTFESLRALREVNKMISNDKATRELGYSSRNFEETVRDTIQWFRDNGYIN